jgi:hypothetical protein
MNPARFRSDELYRLVYQWDGGNEPDWDTLNVRYAGRLGYLVMMPSVELVHPYNAMKCYHDQRIKEIYIAKTWPRDVDTEDPVIACYDEPPISCD